MSNEIKKPTPNSNLVVDTADRNSLRPHTFVNERLMKGISAVPEDSLPIIEIFRTLEGEGLHIGTPRVLVRVDGCAVGCHWCVDENTDIETVDRGVVRAKDIVEGDRLFTMGISYQDGGDSDPLDGTIKCLSGMDITDVQQVLKREVPLSSMLRVDYNVVTNSGQLEAHSVYVTEDHLFLVAGPSVSVWLKAAQLEVGNRLLGSNTHSMYSIDNPNITKEVRDQAGVVTSIARGRELKSKNPKKAKVVNFSCGPYSHYLLDGIIHHNCDTPHSWALKNSRMLKLNDVIEAINKETGGHAVTKEVSITGGEPLHYTPQMLELATQLRRQGYTTSLETSGTIFNGPVFHAFDCVSMDIKTPSSRVPISQDMLAQYNQLWLNHRSVQFKCVIVTQDDLDWVEKNLIHMLQSSRSQPLILTPGVVSTRKAANLPAALNTTANLILSWNKGYNIRVIAQQHALLQYR